MFVGAAAPLEPLLAESAGLFAIGLLASVEVVVEVVLEVESGADVVEDVPGVVTDVVTVVDGEVESLVAGEVVVVLAMVELEEIGGVEAVAVLDGFDEVTASLG